MKTEYKIGDLVENPLKPEWGPGKILETSGSKVTVYFRDVSVRAVRTIETSIVELKPVKIGSDPFLDNLPPYNTDSRKTYHKRLTLADGLDKFRHYYPLLFNDPAYLTSGDTGERGYKLEARELFLNTLGDGKGRQLLNDGELDELKKRFFIVENHLNLLSPYEKMALKDGLENDQAAISYFGALFDVIEAPGVDQDIYERLIASVNGLPHEEGRARVATWPVLTEFPFIARPDCHMFLKPEVTKSCADRMLFDLNYRPALNWRTYSQLLALSKALFDVLEPLGARDYIDVQSFIWTIGGV